MKLLNVRVISPRGESLKIDAKSVSSKNSSGKFDILPEHANFVTLIEEQPVFFLKENNTTEKIQFKMAILHTYGNKVNIYTDLQEVELESASDSA